MFRIVQEGLRNLKKHSGVEEAQADLRINGDRLQVTVRDEGCGFDLKNPRQDEGIGIRSMGRTHTLAEWRISNSFEAWKGDNA